MEINRYLRQISQRLLRMTNITKFFRLSVLFAAILLAPFFTYAAELTSLDFFKGKAFASTEDLSNFRKQLLASRLLALQERPLTEGMGTEKYRIMRLRAKDRSMCLSVEINENGRAIFSAKIGKKKEEGEGIFCCNTWEGADSLIRFMEQNAIQTALFTKRSFSERTGLDGELWLIEAFNNGQYHAILAWSPKDGIEKTIGDAFIAFWKQLTPRIPCGKVEQNESREPTVTR